MGRRARILEANYTAVRQNVFALCQALNFKPTWQQKELLELVQRREPRIACKSGQGPGKCLPGHVEILDTKSGELRRIEDLVGEDPVVFSKDPTGAVSPQHASCFSSGSKPCVRVRTHSGAWVDASEDHPLLTQRGWIPAAQLVQGDLLAMPRRLRLPPMQQRFISRHVVLLAAYLGSDGGTSCSVRFTNMTTAVLGEFRDSAMLAGGSCRELASRSRATELSVSGILPLVAEMGYKGCLAKNKRAPSWVFCLSDKQVALFLNRFWACDGYVEKDGFAITLASEGMIRDLQTLLLRLGIFSNFRYKVSKCDGKEFDSWRLSVRGEDAIRFYEKVRPPLAKERKSRELYVALLSTDRNTNTDVVPIYREQMREVCEELGIVSQRGRGPRLPGLSLSDVRRMCRGRQTPMSRQKFAAFCDVANYTGKYSWLATSDIRWTRFESLEELGTLAVYDLSVPPNANFVAQNLIVHNTTVSTIIGMFRLLQHEGSMGVLTAPTMRQCRDIWLAEARRVLRRADPWLKRLIKVQSTKIQVAERRDWEIKTMTATNEEAAQGFHEENLFVIVEEASGVPRSLITQFKGTLSNPNSLFLMIGNPNTRDCAFFDCFNSQRHNWATLTFDAEQTPKSSWFDPIRNDELAEEFGKNSDVYRVRVMGQFPHADPNCIMSSDDIEKVVDRKLMRTASLRNSAKQFGIDLARFGGDESTLYRRTGEAIVQWTNVARVEPAQVLRLAMKWQLDAGWRDEHCWYVPDAGGMGQGAMHVLYEANKRVFEFHTQGCATQPEKYANLMTEGWFSLAKKVRKGLCYLPNDPLLIQQLAARQYLLNKKGQIIVESKDEYKKRGHPSPDRADGCIMSMLDVVYPDGLTVLTQRGASRVVGVAPK